MSIKAIAASAFDILRMGDRLDGRPGGSYDEINRSR
jgi:hypothetical protein